MSKTYFSKRHGGPRERDVEHVSERLWLAALACIETFTQKNYLAEAFPDACPDNSGIICGTDEGKLLNTIKGHIESIKEWPPRYTVFEKEQTGVALDIIEFFYDHLSKPDDRTAGHHPFFDHSHYYNFSKSPAQAEFREKINDLFAHNGLVYELHSSGEITRIGPPVLREELNASEFRTIDPELNRMLDVARKKFHSRDNSQRVEALEKLWDAWERIKTINNPTDKNKSMEDLLSKAVPDVPLRDKVRTEAKELTSIGNSFMIRHSEVGKIPIQDPNHVDYLFHRMFSIIYLLLKSVPRSGVPAANAKDDDMPF